MYPEMGELYYSITSTQVAKLHRLLNNNMNTVIQNTDIIYIRRGSLSLIYLYNIIKMSLQQSVTSI